MRKYFFKEKLEKGILIKRPGRMFPSVFVNGMEAMAACPSWRNFCKHIENGASCLVRRSGVEGYYQICAVALGDADGTGKNWICTSAAIFEEAIGFFLEKHQVQELNADYGNVIRNAVPKPAPVDYFAGDIMIEIKCSFEWIYKMCRNRKHGSELMPTAYQMLRFVNLMNTPAYSGKRAVFLLIQQNGVDSGQLHPVSSGIMFESLKTMMRMGMEFWLAGMEFDAEGISLVSCQNVGGMVLSDGHEKY